MSYSKLHIPSMTPAPGYDGQIDEQVVGVGLSSEVLGGQGYKTDDNLLIFWNGKRVDNRDIIDDEVEKGVIFNIEKKYVVPGDATLKYTIIDSLTGNSTDSDELQLKVNPAT